MNPKKQVKQARKTYDEKEIHRAKYEAKKEVDRKKKNKLRKGYDDDE